MLTAALSRNPERQRNAATVLDKILAVVCLRRFGWSHLLAGRRKRLRARVSTHVDLRSFPDGLAEDDPHVSPSLEDRSAIKVLTSTDADWLVPGGR
jgi:hypothetical protein